MNNSTIKKWWPVTYDYGLIQTEAEAAVHEMQLMYREHQMDPELLKLSGSLEDCLKALEPLSPIPTKEMYLNTNFGWTVFFRNATRGSDPFLPMKQLSNRLGVTAMRVCITPDNASYTGVIWEVYQRPEAGGDKNGYRRSIAAANDGGSWVFEQLGDAYSFEELEKYRLREKKRRFTDEMLHRYLGNFGIPHLDDNVFAGHKNDAGFILQRPKHDDAPSITLKEFLSF